MKKLLDSKFLFIVALSLVGLILLGLGAFYLYRPSNTSFLRSGYVLNPLSASVEKYYFEKDTDYRENLSAMIEFKDVDDNDATILKESFLHYDDGAMSLLKDGAILDLNSINGKDAVKLYNITSESIIEKENNGFSVKSNGEKINLRNFVGRISDDKYIVAGDLEAIIPGNNTPVKGEYFEVVYTEEGVINIENNNVKYQVTADGTKINVGELVIDLGKKAILKNDEGVMSLTAITINGDENIEIIPKAEDTSTSTSTSTSTPGEGDGTGQGGGQGQGTGNNPTPDNPGQGGEIEVNPDATTITLKEANIGSTNIDVTFKIENQLADDNFTLKVANLDNGRTVDIVKNVKSEEEIMVNLLSPKTKYLFTLINEKDENKYFQKIFLTSEFGIKLEKKKATSSELTFDVTVGKDTDIRNAKLSLYKYDEESKQNEIVTVRYYDKETESYKEVAKTVDISSLMGNLSGTYEVTFDMLDSNTIYTAVLDEFSVVSTNFKDIYNINLTTMTLKETPTFDTLTINKDIGAAKFKLALSDIVDKDTAITKYTYLIYERGNTTETVIDPITRTNASAIEVEIGEGNNKLKNDTNYYYKVVIEYFDNEKYIEYITTDSINFLMGTEPYITVVPDNAKINYDAIGATIYLIDNSCTITSPGREKCDGESSVMVDVSRVNALTGDKDSVYTKNIEFVVSENEVKYDLFVDGLQAGTTYTIEVRSIRNDLQTDERLEIMHTEESKKNITTKTLSSFINEWQDLDSNASTVVHLNTKLIGKVDSGTLDPDASAESIKKVIVKLYAGYYLEDLNLATEIGRAVYTNTDEFNIKEKFYDNSYEFTSEGDFELDIDALRASDPDGNGKLSEYYTLAFYAYFDEREENEVRLDNNVWVYKISPILLMENVNDPRVVINEVPNKIAEFTTNLLSDTTVVGYKVTAVFDKSGLIANHLRPSKINYKVYDAKGDEVSFYTYENGSLRLVNKLTYDISALSDDEYPEPKIYMANGTAYGVKDTNMTRGNKYYVGYYLELADTDGVRYYPDNKNQVIENRYGIYESETAEKETPSVKTFVAKSTANSITYAYLIKDADNALYKESDADNYSLYYKVNDGDEKKLSLTRIDGEVTTFSGNATISGLHNNDVYQLYFKKNKYKTGEAEEDIASYYDNDDEGKKLFDGYYNASDSAYEFKYSVVNDQNADNKVTIKILGSDTFVNRVVSYKVKFTDSKGNSLDKEFWDLTNCGNDDEERCFSVDYIELKNAHMKSEINHENVITVNVTALYDNGLMGYDYVVGEGGDYPYMILQDNNTAEGYGAYLAFSSRGQLTQWTDEISMPKGYYTYTLSTNRLGYKSALNAGHSVSISRDLQYGGYYSNFGYLNPKMIDVTNMTSDNKTFSFSSITPKISITRKTPIINGAVIDMNLSGADIEDFCEEHAGNTCVNTASGTKYLYIDTWANETDVGDFDKVARSRIQVPIDNNNPANTITAVIDKLENAKDYYYQVYAYINKNDQSVYTQLYDASYVDDYETKTYTFQSLVPDDIFKDFEFSYRSDTDGEYNDKIIDTKINLFAYKNNIPFNFNIKYAFCNDGDNECGINDGENIYNRLINSNDLATTFTDSQKINELNLTDDLEFDKNYRLYIYAVYDVYENGSVVTRTLHLNRRTTAVNLNLLTTPEFIIHRTAGYGDSDYYIDLEIVVKDKSKVLTDGKYYVNLLDNSGAVVGTLKVKDGNTYRTIGTGNAYKDYEFSAEEIGNKHVRITGLTQNTKYTISVYSDAYINNATILPITDRNMHIEKGHTVYTTNSSGVAFGRDIVYTATERSIVVTFLGGSNFDKVRTVSYTIGLWDNDASSLTFQGDYEIGDDKQFERYKDTEEPYLVINPEGMVNTLGQIYTVGLEFGVWNEVENRIDYYDSTNYPELAGRAPYVKD